MQTPKDPQHVADNLSDKVAEDKKREAHEKFQKIAFAYAVLSDPARRKRYDETGSTSEAIIDSDGFSWTDFYRAQFADAISSDAVKKFADTYKHSDEEKHDVLAAYEQYKGDMDKVYEYVMVSNVLDDDQRFRQIIDDGIAAGEVQAFLAYTKESKTSKRSRLKEARREAKEAEALAKELGVHNKLFGKTQGSKGSDQDLAAMILHNQKKRNEAVLGALEQKYASQTKSAGKKGRKRSVADMNDGDIPDEEFEAIQANMLKAKDNKAKKHRSDMNRD